MKPGKKVRVLSICDDDSIRFSRELVLRHEGYSVESVTSKTHFDPAWVRGFHIAILCHSATPLLADRITELLRRVNPMIRVVRVQSDGPESNTLYDRVCRALPSPSELLQAMEALSPTEQLLSPAIGRKQA